MNGVQLSFFIEDIPPIPECSYLCEMTGRLPNDLANEMAREARLWSERNPDKSIMPLIVPEWREYIRYRLGNDTQTA